MMLVGRAARVLALAQPEALLVPRTQPSSKTRSADFGQDRPGRR